MRQAYADVEKVLGQFGFVRVQGSVFVTENEDLTRVVRVMNELRALPWFPESVRGIRAFRVEMWSDFTSLIKE